MGWLTNWFQEGITVSPNIELGTTKKQVDISKQYSYSPVITRTYDIQYNLAREGSTISTKKEQAIEQTATPTQTSSQIPVMGGSKLSTPSESGGAGAFENISDILIIGGLVVGAIIIIPKFLMPSIKIKKK